MPIITSPNYGLIYNETPLDIPSRGLRDGLNFRAKNGTLESFNLGWAAFSAVQLDSAVRLIDNFFPRNLAEKLIFGTTQDLYLYDGSTDSVSFITPTYSVGTAAASGTVVTGTGTEWEDYGRTRYNIGTASASGSTVTGTGTQWTGEVLPGDEIHFGSSTETSPTATWYVVQSVTDDDTLVLTATAGTVGDGPYVIRRLYPNVRAGDMISFGSAAEADPDAVWFEVDTVNSDTSITLTDDAGTVADGPYTIRRRFQNQSLAKWSVDTFVNDGESGEDLWFATNGVDPVVTYNGTDTSCVLHPELEFTCEVLATYSNMMVYGHITQGGEYLPTTIINSDVGLPLRAGARASGISEQFVSHSGTDGISNIVPIGDYMVLYCERTVIPVQFVGDPLIFLFRVAISGVGPISGDAIADFGDFHEFLGHDAGYMFDGVTLKETNAHVWRDVLRRADPQRRVQAYAHFDEEQGDLIWSIPTTEDGADNVGVIGAPPSQAWSEHYLEDPGERLAGSPFSRRTFPFTATGFYQKSEGLRWVDIAQKWNEFNYAWNDQFLQAAFPINLGGDADGRIWILNENQTANGTPLPSYVRTGRTLFSTDQRRDLLTRVYPFAHKLPYNLEITAFMGDHAGGEPTSKGTQIFDQNLPEGQHFVVFYRRGRTLELQFGSSAGEPWSLDGWDYELVKGGRR